MTDPQVTPVADPGPPPPRPPGAPRGGDRFFSWTRGLGLVRGDGWVGGVCAGIAARLGIDPVIVRGVFVVAALFGLPVFLVYAAGWALLPDLEGRIHLQELIRGRFDPAVVGIGMLVLLGFVPVIPWFVGMALPFGTPMPWSVPPLSPLGILWTLLVTAVIVGVVLILVRSSRRIPSSGEDPRTASADSGIPAPQDSGPDGAQAGPVDPAGPASMDSWRTQHDAWRAHDDAWRRQQQDAARAAADQARAERVAAGAAFAAEAAERRRIRRATRPRTSVATVLLALGAALVVGAAAALAASATGVDDTVLVVAIGFFAGAIVIGLAMVAAGGMRRRSGFLAFTAVLLLVVGTVTAAVPITRGIAFGNTSTGTWDPRSFTQVWGSLSIDLADLDMMGVSSTTPIVIDKRGAEPTSIYVGYNTAVDLRVEGVDTVYWTRFDRNGEHLQSGTWTSGGQRYIRRQIDNGASAGDRQVVRLEQSTGTVDVMIYEQ